MCQQCEEKPVYKFTNKRKLCARCFVRYFQKKVLYTIRKFNMAKQGDIIFYKLQNDFRSVVLEDVLKFFSEKSGAKLIKINRMINKPAKIAVPSTLDLEADKIVHAIILENAGIFSLKNKTLPIEKTGKKEIIKPLYLFLDEEILLYAGIRGLKFKKRATKNDKLSSFISTLEKKHPEIKRAVINSWLRIQGK